MPPKSLKKSDPFHWLTGHPSYWTDRPSIILIDYLFMLFRSVKCHWSLVDCFFPASCIFSVRLLCDLSINQSVKALSTAISHSGQDSGQDVQPHTRSVLPLALSSKLPNQRVRAVYHSGASSKGNTKQIEVHLSVHLRSSVHCKK